MKKVCRKCRKLKPPEEFSRGRMCDPCRRISRVLRAAYLEEWRKVNGAYSSAKWRRQNPDYDREYNRRRSGKRRG